MNEGKRRNPEMNNDYGYFDGNEKTGRNHRGRENRVSPRIIISVILIGICLAAAITALLIVNSGTEDK